VRRVVLAAAQHDDPRRALLAEQARDAGVEPCRDAIEHENRRHLAPALHFGKHAAAHAGTRLQIMEREPPA